MLYHWFPTNLRDLFPNKIPAKTPSKVLDSRTHTDRIDIYLFYTLQNLHLLHAIVLWRMCKLGNIPNKSQFEIRPFCPVTICL